jgi:hypothetical protein
MRVVHSYEHDAVRREEATMRAQGQKQHGPCRFIHWPEETLWAVNKCSQVDMIF